MKNISHYTLSAITLTTLVLYFAKSNVLFISSDATSPVIGIVFCLIIVQVELSNTHGISSTTLITDSLGWPCTFSQSSGYATHRSDSVVEEHNGKVYSLQARPMQVAVEITQDVKVDSNSDSVAEEGGSDISLDKNIPDLSP